MDELDQVHVEINRLLDRYPSESWTLPQARLVLRALAGFGPHLSSRACSVYRHRV